ncbi:MAG: TIGR02444 family protein [Pseudomonadota bacterium]
MTSTNPFWEFSIQLYKQPGVAKACVAAQDQWGADVNLLLFIAWQSQQGACMQMEAIAALDESVRGWREQVVQPIRELRRKLKAFSEAEASRALIQQAELAAERSQQDSMLTHVGAAESILSGKGLTANLDCYREFLKLPDDAFDDVCSVLETGLRTLATL